MDFNPRSREGSDADSFDVTLFSLNFNPRSREGSDDMVIRDCDISRISIHAPAKGATMLKK